MVVLETPEDRNVDEIETMVKGRASRVVTGRGAVHLDMTADSGPGFGNTCPPGGPGSGRLHVRDACKGFCYRQL